MNVVYIIGIFLSLFLSFLLLTKKGKGLPDKVLAIWMAVVGLHLFSYYIYYLGYWGEFPHLIGVFAPVPLLHGPLCYLYALFSIRKERRLRALDFAHFIPLVGAYLYMIPFFLFTAEQKVLVDKGLIDDFGTFTELLLVAFAVSGLSYSVLSYRLIGRYQRLIGNNFSYDEQIDLSWLRYCIWGIAAIFIVVTIGSILTEGLRLNLGFDINIVYYSLVVIFILCIGYFGIRHKDIFSDNVQQPSLQIYEPKTQGEYKKSGLDSDTAALLHKELIRVMESQKLYIEPKLTLGTLAEQLKVSVNHLSQVINQYEGVNFHDFVNRYRVDEFKSRIANPKYKGFSLLAIAFDSGFNSKSSFNQIFKKSTGLTPSQYLERSAKG